MEFAHYEDIDMDALTAEAEQFKEQLAEAQREVDETLLKGYGADGMVTVTSKGTGEVLDIEIHGDAMREYDADTLGQVVMEALQHASSQSLSLFHTKIGSLMPEPGELVAALDTLPPIRG